MNLIQVLFLREAFDFNKIFQRCLKTLARKNTLIYLKFIQKYYKQLKLLLQFVLDIVRTIPNRLPIRACTCAAHESNHEMSQRYDQSYSTELIWYLFVKQNQLTYPSLKGSLILFIQIGLQFRRQKIKQTNV